MLEKILQRHRELFKEDEEIRVVRAPGRINLIGEHIDYHGGVVLPAAIDKAIYVTVSKTSTSTSVYSVDHDSWYRSGEEENANWSGYIEQLIAIAREHDLPMGGFHGVIESTLPVGAGLSSSAALTSGFIYGLDHLYEWGLTRLEMAEFGQAIEHGLGVACGLMDQFAVLHGKQDHVIKLDCLVNTHTYHEADLGEANLHLLNSGVSHNLADSAYNDRRRVTQEGLQLIKEQFPQVGSYRDVTMEIVERAHALNEEQTMLATYIVEEMNRVAAAVDTLERGDTRQFGSLLKQTHAGLRDLYQVTCEETDLLFDLAIQNESVLGARQMGGGFGGCVLVLTQGDEVEPTLTRIADAYHVETGIETTPFPVRLANGVDFLSY